MMRRGERVLLALCVASIGAIAYAGYVLWDAFTRDLR